MPRALCRFFTAFCLISLVATLAACTAEESVSPENSGNPSIDNSGNPSLPRAIINGTPATGPRYDAVVQLVYQGYGVCSGTLITDTVVLTAAHCLYVKDCEYNYATGEATNCQLETNPDRIWVYVTETPNDSNYQARQAIELYAHADYDSEAFINDIALVRIASPFQNVTPIPALPIESAITEADVGLSGIDVGFGVTENGTSGDRLMLEQNIDEVCLDDEYCSPGTPNTMCSYYKEGLICSGDSGGPFLIERDNVTYVAAVHAYSDYKCSYYSCNTIVTSFSDWIAEFIGGNDLNNGAECVNHGQCQSGICSLGVCCDTACTDSPCYACSTARGASQNGVCGPTRAQCDDGDLCTLGDSCFNGACQSGTPKECDQGNDCVYASQCDSATGQCLPGEYKPNNIACDDNNACTLGDYCLWGSCVSEGTVYCPPPDECQMLRGNGCNIISGECMYTDKPNGAACGQNGETCQNGVCRDPSKKVVTNGCGIVENDAEGNDATGNDAALALFFMIFALQCTPFKKTRFQFKETRFR